MNDDLRTEDVRPCEHRVTTTSYWNPREARFVYRCLACGETLLRFNPRREKPRVREVRA